MKPVVPGLCVALLSMTATLAAAQPAAIRHGEAEEFLRGLKLTDAQEDKIQKITDEARTTAKPITEQLQTLHGQVIVKLLTPKSTPADVTPLLKTSEDLRHRYTLGYVDTMMKVRDVLTPDQLREASANYQKMLEARAKFLAGDRTPHPQKLVVPAK